MRPTKQQGSGARDALPNMLASTQTVTTPPTSIGSPPLALATTIPHPTAPDQPDIEAGTVLGHYEIIRKLGAGGMGMVFLARDTRLGRLVAIKLLLEHTGSAAQRFLAEARVTARCRHDNIVIIYDLGEHDGYPYMVLEYIEGRTLREFMSQDERPTQSAREQLAIELMLPVVRALACAHEMGIVHRDLKPENILLTNSGQIKVLDFGIAKQNTVELAIAITADQISEQHLAELTQDGAVVGTMPYMSPEQWLGEGIDGRSDIWAVGIILFELLTGEHPLDPISPHKLLVKVMTLIEPMPSAHNARPDAGPLADVIDRCLKKHKNERMGSARELLEALERIDAGRRTLTPLAEQAEVENLFAGLSAFQESDAGRFFGRDHDIAAVIGKLRNQELIAIVGPSGAGKSSFVRAGVIPALKRAGRQVEAFVIRPGRRPLAALADVIACMHDTSREQSDPEGSDPELIAATLRSQPGYLGARLRARCRRRGPDQRIVLFVDQLEELYTLGTEPTERAAFCSCLEGVADDASSPLRVVLSMRADFLDRLSEDRRFLAEVTRGLFFLPPITREGLRDALLEPLEAVRYRFEDEGLCQDMLDGLAGTKSPLPLLQFTAAKLWEARDRNKRLLTRQAYQALGGVAGALSTHADAVLSSLSLPEQRLAHAILLRLVTPERTRAIVRLDELRGLAEDASAMEQVVHHLAGARLVLIEAGGEREGKTVELTHESLIDRWAKLRQWLDENEQDAQFLAQLRNAAQQWEQSAEAEGLLWRDRAALEAGQWLARRKTEQGSEGTIALGNREQRYLEAVVRHSERTRQRRRQLLAVLVSGLSLVVLVVSFLALQAIQEAARAEREKAEAQAQKAEAEHNAAHARNATRVAAARGLEEDPTTVLALLREIEPGSVPRGWAERAWWARGAGVASAVLFHDDLVYKVAFSPDGRRIASASEDKTVRVWNADGSGQPIILRGHESRVYAAAFSPDGKRIVSASEDTTVRVWNADGSGQPLILRGHESRVYAAAFSPDGKRIVSASLDKTVRVWNAEAPGQALILRGHTDRILAAAFSPDGERIVSASWDKTIRVWNADGSGQPLILQGHDNRIFSAAFSPDGQRIVSASMDKTLRVWNADGSGQALILRGHDDTIREVAFSPDGKRILSASDDKTVRLWNADGSGRALLLRGHDASVFSAAFSPDGKRIVSASIDKTLRIWNADGSLQPLILRGHDDHILAAAFSPDGKRIVSSSLDKTLRIWNADGSGQPLLLRGHNDAVISAAFSPDGERIVSASLDKTVRVWNADGSGQPLILRGHEVGVSSVAFSPDGKRIVSASPDKTLRIWNADGSGQPLILRGHEFGVSSAAFSPDGKRIVSASEDKTIRIWNADGSGQALVLRGHDAGVSSAAFSPDGKRIVSTSPDETVRVWSVDGSQPPIVLRGHAQTVYKAAFSPDGARIVSASEDATVRIWNADGTGEAFILRASNEGVYMASWSPDGRRIVAASADKTLIVWSNLEPLQGAEDPRLWTDTSYCMPLDVRQRLLDFPEEQSRADLERCQRRVRETQGR